MWGGLAMVWVLDVRGGGGVDYSLTLLISFKIPLENCLKPIIFFKGIVMGAFFWDDPGQNQ